MRGPGEDNFGLFERSFRQTPSVDASNVVVQNGVLNLLTPPPPVKCLKTLQSSFRFTL